MECLKWTKDEPSQIGMEFDTKDKEYNSTINMDSPWNQCSIGLFKQRQGWSYLNKDKDMANGKLPNGFDSLKKIENKC